MSEQESESHSDSLKKYILRFGLAKMFPSQTRSDSHSQKFSPTGLTRIHTHKNSAGLAPTRGLVQVRASPSELADLWLRRLFTHKVQKKKKKKTAGDTATIFENQLTVSHSQTYPGSHGEIRFTMCS